MCTEWRDKSVVELWRKWTGKRKTAKLILCLCSSWAVHKSEIIVGLFSFSLQDVSLFGSQCKLFSVCDLSCILQEFSPNPKRVSNINWSRPTCHWGGWLLTIPGSTFVLQTMAILETGLKMWKSTNQRLYLLPVLLPDLILADGKISNWCKQQQQTDTTCVREVSNKKIHF